MRISDQRLSPNFHLSEFVRSETAERHGIDNTPSPEIIEQLRLTAATAEQVRALLDCRPMHVHSGFRCEALERILCEKDFAGWCRRHNMMPGEPSWRVYFARKQHPQGTSWDFTVPAFGTPAQICRRIAGSTIAFHQLIFEHTWVHMTRPLAGNARPKREVLTLAGGGYVAGIVEAA